MKIYYVAKSPAPTHLEKCLYVYARYFNLQLRSDRVYPSTAAERGGYVAIHKYSGARIPRPGNKIYTIEKCNYVEI